MRYHYQPGSDGCDETFDIMDGDDFLVSVHYWEEREWAEARAKLITDALNAYKPSLFERVCSVVRKHDRRNCQISWMGKVRRRQTF